ncbi:MAG: hypothetical protein GXX99_03465 [Clostridiales bacterium]|nr:hypothetical protein [Clostridiales bacterium]
MFTHVLCSKDGTIFSVGRGEALPSESEVDINVPEGGFLIDLTDQAPFDTLDLLDIHNGYKANPRTKKLVKLK